MNVHTSSTYELPVHELYHDPFRFSDPCIAILKNQIKIRTYLNQVFTSH